MTEETLTAVGVFFYVIGNYSVIFLLHKNAPPKGFMIKVSTTGMVVS